MQFSTVAAISALAAVASATYPLNGTVVYTTEVFTAYTTFCPASTELTYAGITYTATEATTLTITNCPCTIVKPVTTSSVVAPTSSASAIVPVYPTTAPVYVNSTAAATSYSAVGTGSATVPASASSTPSTISSSGAGKVALSGASLAGVLGLAAFFL